MAVLGWLAGRLVGLFAEVYSTYNTDGGIDAVVAVAHVVVYVYFCQVKC